MISNSTALYIWSDLTLYDRIFFFHEASLLLLSLCLFTPASLFQSCMIHADHGYKALAIAAAAAAAIADWILDLTIEPRFFWGKLSWLAIYMLIARQTHKKIPGVGTSGKYRLWYSNCTTQAKYRQPLYSLAGLTVRLWRFYSLDAWLKIGRKKIYSSIRGL